MKRTFQVIVIALGAVVVALLGTYAVFTRTDFGRERVRGLVMDWMHDNLHGVTKVGRFEGNVAGTFSMADISIADSAGEPFVTADRATASINVWALLDKRIIVPHLVLINPVVRVTRTPHREWNYARILHTEGPAAPDTTLGFGNWVALHDVTVRGGTLIVQQPWIVDSTQSAASRDSLTSEALGGKTRVRVDKADYGLRQTSEFRSIDGHFPSIVIADPSTRDVVLDVDTLSMTAAPFNPPAFGIRQFTGHVRVGDDTVTVDRLTLGLPGSHATGSLRYIIKSGDILTKLTADTLALADIRGLYPPLPDSGGGTLVLDAAIRTNAPSDYVVTDATLSVGRATVAGTLGLTTDDTTTRFYDTDLRFTRFPTWLVKQIAPQLESPVAGEFGGRAQLTGDMDRMQVNIDAILDAQRQPPFRVVARGGLGFGEFVTTNRLFVRADRIPVSLAEEFGTKSTIGGTINATATLTGSTASNTRATFAAVHREADKVSELHGDGTVAVGDSMRMDLRLRLDSISMDLLEDFDSTTDYRGVIAGTATVKGTPRNIASRVDLVVPGNGAVNGDVTYELPGDTIPVYSATLSLLGINVQESVAKLPVTLLNGTTTFKGRGTDPGTIDAQLLADLKNTMVDSMVLREVVVTAQAREGVLHVDTARVETTFGSATADGTLGLVEGRTGTLRYKAELKDLGGVSRWIAMRDTSTVEPRPAISERLTRLKATADSIREAKAAAVDPASQLAKEMQAPRPRGAKQDVIQVPAIPRDSLAGSVTATGEVTGQVKNLDLSANGKTSGIIFGGNFLGAGTAKLVWRFLGTEYDSLAVEAGVDSLQVGGFALDSTRVRGHYVRGRGDAELAVYPGDTAEYKLTAEYALKTGEGEVFLRQVRLRFDSTGWASTHPSRISWRGQGITFDSLELRNHEGLGGGRIFVNGEVPDVDPGRVEVIVDSLRIAPWMTLLQSNVAADGIANLHIIAEGTRGSPQFDGTLRVANPSYEKTPFPDVAATFKYEGTSLTLESVINRTNGPVLAHIAGKLPMDLSFDDSVETRLIESAPLALTIEGDSIPLSPLSEFIDELTTIDGRAYGKVVVSGTWSKPHLEGGMNADLRRLGLASTGVLMTKVTARSRMSGDTLVIDSLLAVSDGTIQGHGTIAFLGLTQPVLQLEVTAKDARVLDDERGELFASGQAAIQGPIDSLVVGGRATISRGVVYIPDPEEFDIINTEDPAIFAVVDTATAKEIGVAPISETMKNLVLDMDVRVNRGTFGRSRDANVEVYGDLNVLMNPSTHGEYALTGALFTDYGDYTFLGKRFIVSRGSVRFTGDTDLNPNLQVLATYEVRQAGRPPLDIRVVIGGTLEQPKISLESDAQPTLSQSDLISFLAFGRSSSSLLQFSGTGLEGGGQGGLSLAGNVAALATKQLASIALGAVADKAKADLAGATRADVLNITPAELPADLKSSGLQTLLRGTEVEIGKYVDRNTFLLGRVRPTLAIPGAFLERRFGRQFKVRTSFETRFQARRPSLSASENPKEIGVFGSTLRWSLVW